ncbi:DNA-binding protein [Boudabousia liubingyangii]|uniref:DNA-binding protein n=1 Tax=Boudabousia liubingyangii TaxID=1921764 RepID=A0A1Q5PLP8_9ACTO|nr:helix-turn-helix domain-containing protein [Boudabousia liubingyangii]OKL46924.1 DNA-binding protein [Boudabousia liubingyangii]OKL47966.1 DNA-binding protein [Boudabousia liubingyangii]
MSQPPRPKLATVAEIADLLRVSKMTVYRMIHDGELPAIRVGRSFRVPQTVVDQLLDQSGNHWADERQNAIGE